MSESRPPQPPVTSIIGAGQGTLGAPGDRCGGLSPYKRTIDSKAGQALARSVDNDDGLCPKPADLRRRRNIALVPAWPSSFRRLGTKPRHSCRSPPPGCGRHAPAPQSPARSDNWKAGIRDRLLREPSRNGDPGVQTMRKPQEMSDTSTTRPAAKKPVIAKAAIRKENGRSARNRCVVRGSVGPAAGP